MNNDDERDYAEEAYNRELIRNPDEDPDFDWRDDCRDLIATVQADNPRPAAFVAPLPGTQAWRERYVYLPSHDDARSDKGEWT